MNRTTFRRARVPHRCRCGTMIFPGDDYMERVISPDHGDVGNTGWWRDTECRDCSIRHGHWPIPWGGVIQR